MNETVVTDVGNYRSLVEGGVDCYCYILLSLFAAAAAAAAVNNTYCLHFVVVVVVVVDNLDLKLDDFHMLCFPHILDLS